jgi:hypothetical protein
MRKQAIETAKISIKSGGYGFRPTCDQFKPYRPMGRRRGMNDALHRFGHNSGGTETGRIPFR